MGHHRTRLLLLLLLAAVWADDGNNNNNNDDSDACALSGHFSIGRESSPAYERLASAAPPSLLEACYRRENGGVDIWEHERRDTAQNTAEIWLLETLAPHPCRIRRRREAEAAASCDYGATNGTAAEEPLASARTSSSSSPSSAFTLLPFAPFLSSRLRSECGGLTHEQRLGLLADALEADAEERQQWLALRAQEQQGSSRRAPEQQQQQQQQRAAQQQLVLPAPTTAPQVLKKRKDDQRFQISW